MPLTFRQVIGTILEEDYVEHPDNKRSVALAEFLVEYWLSKEVVDKNYQRYFEIMSTRHEKR